MLQSRVAAAAGPSAKAPPGETVPVPAAPVETGIENFLNLMQRELVVPLGKVTELATRIEELRAAGYLPATLEGQKAFAELADASRHSAEAATRLIGLGELLVGNAILADEYILVADSLRAAAGQLTGTATDRGVGLRLDESNNNLAPVYGSTRWLTLALRSLLGQLVDAAPAGSHVLARLRQVGFHQLLTAGINHNQPAPITLNLLRTDSRQPVKAALAAADSLHGLDLALATAVVELHGGTLKTDITEAGALNQVTLTLPTGEPQVLRRRPDCANCPSMHQAEQFAQDIGELLNAMQAEQQNISIGSRK